jgi:hypothetical protein
MNGPFTTCSPDPFTTVGKSYEAWVKKYWEKRAKGETNISIEPEALE